MNLDDLLKGEKGQEIISQIASQFNLDQKQAASIVQSAIPTILGGLQHNAQTPKGAEALHNALSSHEPSLLDNLGSILGNAQGLQQDGMGILGHVFGNQNDQVKQSLSKSTGVNASQIGPILATLAPIVMSYLSKQKQTNKVNNPIDLGGLLNSISGGNGGWMDIVGSILGGGNSKGGTAGAIGSILGNILKK
ncbi:MAG: DUF937 domain-containing protein [Chitinophagales bacterium]|nr:DUF937 domain-containing protein [Chitinophagales bacterium]